MAPEAFARRLIAWLLACCLAGACARDGRDVTLAWTIEPTPPVQGTGSIVRLALKDNDGRPLGGAKLQIEAHMSHPGMAPVVAAAAERAEGVYEARVVLTMAGDWVFVVTGQLANGQRLSREIQVPGVRPGA